MRVNCIVIVLSFIVFVCFHFWLFIYIICNFNFFFGGLPYLLCCLTDFVPSQHSRCHCLQLRQDTSSYGSCCWTAPNVLSAILLSVLHENDEYR